MSCLTRTIFSKPVLFAVTPAAQQARCTPIALSWLMESERLLAAGEWGRYAANAQLLQR